MFRYFPLILKNCWRNRRRTVLTIAEHRGFHVPAGRDDRHVSRVLPERAHQRGGAPPGGAQPHLADGHHAGILCRAHQADSRACARSCTRSGSTERTRTRGIPRTSSRASPSSPTSSSRCTPSSAFPKTSARPSCASAPPAWSAATWPTPTTSTSATASPWWAISSRATTSSPSAASSTARDRQRRHVLQPRVPGTDAAGTAPRADAGIYLSS